MPFVALIVVGRRTRVGGDLCPPRIARVRLRRAARRRLRVGPRVLARAHRAAAADARSRRARSAWWRRSLRSGAGADSNAKPLAGSDWLLAALLVDARREHARWPARPDVVAADAISPMWRLVMSFIVPAGLYWIARASAAHRIAQWIGSLAILSVLGVYLVAHGPCRNHRPVVARVSALHRRSDARHPLRPRPRAGAQLGQPGRLSHGVPVVRVDCFAANVRRELATRAAGRAAADGAGVFFTYTRSTWIGLAASGAVVGCLQLPRSLAAAAVHDRRRWCGILVAAATWNDVVGLEREGTAERIASTRSISASRSPTSRGRCSRTIRCSASASAGSTTASCPTFRTARRTSSSNRSARCIITTRS